MHVRRRLSRSSCSSRLAPAASLPPVRGPPASLLGRPLACSLAVCPPARPGWPRLPVRCPPGPLQASDSDAAARACSRLLPPVRLLRLTLCPPRSVRPLPPPPCQLYTASYCHDTASTISHHANAATQPAWHAARTPQARSCASRPAYWSRPARVRAARTLAGLCLLSA